MVLEATKPDVEVLGIQIATKELRPARVQLTGLIHVWDCPYCDRRIQEQFKVCDKCGAEWSGLQQPELGSEIPRSEAVKTVLRNIDIPPAIGALILSGDEALIADAERLLLRNDSGAIIALEMMREHEEGVSAAQQANSALQAKLDTQGEQLDALHESQQRQKAALDARKQALDQREKELDEMTKPDPSAPAKASGKAGRKAARKSEQV